MSMVCRPCALGLLVLALVLPARARAGDDDLQDVLAGLAKCDDPAGRIVRLRRLAVSPSVVAAGALAGLVRRDPDVRVREAAAVGLGESPAVNAVDLLIEAARDGGTRRVRQAVARSLARHAESAARLLDAVRNPRTPDADRALLLATLEAFKDDATRIALLTAARSGAPPVREVALRALARRRSDAARIRPELVAILGEARDLESELTALDALEPAAHPDLRAAVERLATSLEPEVLEASARLLARIRAAEKRAAKAAPRPVGGPAAPDDRYAPVDPPEAETPPGDDPDDPPWPRYDLVYAVDVTGSTAMTLAGLKQRILSESTLLRRLGGSVRVGVLAYRDGPAGPDAPPGVEILAPTCSLERLKAFVEGLKARGVDERGAAVAAALREALDRTPWRWEARREVQLLADTKCDDPRAAAEVVARHYAADTTRTRIAYVLRTRGVLPPEYEDLARLGGTGAAEFVK